MKYDEHDLQTALEAVNTPDNLRAYCEANLERRGRDNYVCPCCNSGTGPNKSAAFSIKNGRWKCFSCNEGGDLLDLIGVREGRADFNDRLEAATSFCGVAMPRAAIEWDATAKNDRPREVSHKRDSQKDYTEGRESHKRILEESPARLPEAPEALDWVRGRGFTDEEITRFNFGLDAEPAHGWQDHTGNWHNGARLVIPWKGSAYYHVDRAIADDAKNLKYDKPPADEVGEQPVTWKGALDGDAVFIVEGLLDAYAVEAMGYYSAPLAGTGYEKVLNSIAKNGYQGIVILMLDGDEAGKTAQAKAAEYCDALKLNHHEADFTADTGYKDACEGLEKGRAKSTEALARISNEARYTLEQKREQRDRETMAALKMQDPTDIAADIFNCKGTEKPISTGFTSLDHVTNGGFRSGLVVLGATSSAGKTTLVTQIADSIAANGTPVLFVTIEQSGRELVSKSLSRGMAQRGYKAVSLWEMSDAGIRERWPEAKTQALFDSMSDYMDDVAPNLVVMAADEQPTVSQIAAAAYSMTEKRGLPPVIFIDYLQLLAPKDERDTDKRAADYNVSALRRLARDLKTPIVVISSLNRTSYSGVIEMESFKESGGIEYGADLLIGLQPYNMRERMKEARGKDGQEARAKEIVTEYRAKMIRQSELTILKNRNGYVPADALPFTYDAASSLFTEGV